MENKKKVSSIEKMIKTVAIGVVILTVVIILISPSSKDQKKESPKSGSSVNNASLDSAANNDQASTQNNNQNQTEVEDVFAENGPKSVDLSSFSIFSITLNGETDLATEIPNHFSRVKKELQNVNPTSPDGKSIRIWDALQKSKIYFPASISKDITGIAFFIYWGTNDLAPSEAILIKNKRSITENASLVRNWEAEMILDLKKFVLIGEKYDLVKVSGKKDLSTSSRFKNSRFINFSQDGAVSLNYTVGDGLIILTNSISIQQKMIDSFIGNLDKKSAL